MGKIRPTTNLSNVKEVPELIRFIQPFLEDVGATINGGLTLNDNMAIVFTEFTFTTANTNYAVRHGLGRVPLGYIPTKQTVAGSLYTGVGSWDSEIIYLKSSVALTATILFF